MAGDAYYPFNDMHAMMAFVATGRAASADRLIAALRHKAGDASSSARLARDVGLPVALALQAFGQEGYEEAADQLLGLRKHAQAFGGSHAQRDVLTLTLLEAARRGGTGSMLRGLLNEREAERGASPWLLALRAGQGGPAPVAMAG